MPLDPAPTNRIFFGEFRHALDSKNRITIRARWRQTDAEEFFIIPHQSGNYLIVMPPGEFEKVSETVAARTEVSAARRQDFIRQFYSKAINATTDRQGRLVLNEDHCQLLKLRGEVMLVGSLRRFEIWQPDRWAEFKRSKEPEYNEVADLVGL